MQAMRPATAAARDPRGPVGSSKPRPPAGPGTPHSSAACLVAPAEARHAAKAFVARPLQALNEGRHLGPVTTGEQFTASNEENSRRMIDRWVAGSGWEAFGRDAPADSTPAMRPAAAGSESSPPALRAGPRGATTGSSKRRRGQEDPQLPAGPQGEEPLAQPHEPRHAGGSPCAGKNLGRVTAAVVVPATTTIADDAAWDWEW